MIVLVVSSQRNRLSAEHQGIDELRLMFEKWKEEEKAEQQVSLGLLSDFLTSGFVGDWILDTLNLSRRKSEILTGTSYPDTYGIASDCECPITL